MLIDIPIGLTKDEPRACNLEVKKCLSPGRQNSVFYTPVREAVYQPNLLEAKQW